MSRDTDLFGPSSFDIGHFSFRGLVQFADAKAVFTHAKRGDSHSA